ncbi:Ras guanine nucleotide exchange factor [Dictyostelium discoideum AX4]|uniref:Ras guanine nucleotide exchange factor F n=1 Tax=Dictyostelium discoideum TaxID=44689 RepID=GEFF_DICDI|nr:Ras guanine nucleotide exchange factor [Dictyostelium discoideum AX4]Q54C94.1 RecName: Full=Ras guanine nucleotide exchange factor F; AltName: Full=RasGEF domain-containing protein F [Dictyostelium discoideum]EAL60855.1 Ras guanine nucleotide exchange factor [Dictyostelium discoideum AX4]|eukprot:XP_629325.1 Ras guanine nucleotide exchange factor [Dictyostelium discoideum AX4]
MTDKLKFKTSLLNKVPPPPPKSNQPSPSTSTPASPNVNSTNNSPSVSPATTSPIPSPGMSPLLTPENNNNNTNIPHQTSLLNNSISNKSSVSFLNNSGGNTINKSSPLSQSSSNIKNGGPIRTSTTLAQFSGSSLPNTENSSPPPSSSLISSSSSPTAESLLYSEDSIASGGTVTVDPNTKNGNIYNGNGLRNNSADILPHNNHTYCVGDDGFYLFGGTLPDGSYTNDFYTFQFAIKAWTILTFGSAPSIRTRHTGVLYNNSMYIFGGYSPSGPKNDIYVFSFDTQTWSEVQTEGTKPSPRYGHTAVVESGHMIVFGGISCDQTTKQQTVNNDIFSLNLDTKQWSQVLSTCPPSPRTHHTATMHKGNMYVFGGQDQQSNQVEDIVHCYTWASNSWKSIQFEGSSMTPRSDHSAVLFQDSIFISGGSSKSQTSQNLEIYEYDLYQKKCFKISSSTIVQNRISHSSVVKGNSILFWGGCTDNSFDYFSFGKDEFEEDYQDDYESNRVQNIPKELWEASLMKKHPEILELREKTLAFTGSKSFAKTLATPSFSENRLALSHQFVLQLIMEYLERNTYHKVIAAIQKESGVLHQPTESGESRLVSLLRLVKPRLRNKNVFDTDLSLFSKEEGNDPEVAVVDHLYHDYRHFDEEEDINVWEEGEDNNRNIRKVETDNNKVQIKAATFNKLIHYLAPKEKAFDPNFLKVFLYTHSSFTTSEKLLKKLIQRYQVPNSNANEPKYKSEVVEPVRQRVVDVLKYWVDKCPWDFNAGPTSSVLVATLNNFIDGSLTRDGNSNIKKLRELKKKLQHEDVRPYSEPPPEPKVPKNIFSPQLTLAHIDELEIARQMTLVESKLFGAIPPPEFMVRVIGYGEFQYNMATSPNLMTFVNRATDVSRWIVHTVLNESRDKKNKMKMLDKFIKTTECLRQLNNFQTLHSVLQGLQHPLLLSRPDLFTPRHREIIADHEMLFSKIDNYKLYREALARSQPACVPWIDIIREDFAQIERDQPSNMNNLINFTKRQNLYEILSKIGHYQFPYNLQIVHQVATFVNKLPKYSEYDLNLLSESLQSQVNSPLAGVYQPSLIGTTGSSSSINLGSARELNNSNRDSNNITGSSSNNNSNSSNSLSPIVKL